MEDIIKTVNLTKHYGRVGAVEGLSLSIRRGEVYAFLGLNGAGKTTTIRMLLGMIRPTGGESFIDGTRVDAGSYRLWEDIGYLVEVPYSYSQLTVRENLDLVRKLRGIDDGKRVDEIIDMLGLGPYRDRKARALSLGNAQRLGLAKAMIHEPAILMLDEPANGLDPAGIVEIRGLLRNLAEEKGVTVFISSHILGEVARLADRIGIIHEGKLVQEVNAGELHMYLRKRLLVDSRDRKALSARLGQMGYAAAYAEEGVLEVREDDACGNPELVNERLVKAGVLPTLLQVEEEDLESYFLRVIGVEGGAA
ncbi:MAG: ABC transporter ATP-binding protein [Spirochaetes bacterium]|nr:ABC transporter ATP-binding protein [Spirochaetota bacterium]